MQPRSLVLLLGILVLVSGLLFLLVPLTVQTGNPFLGQMVDETTTGEFSCGMPLGYAVGSRPWAEDNPESYQRGQFIPVSEECPIRLGENLRTGTMWTAAAVALLVGRQIVTRRHDRKAAARRPQPART